MTALNAAGHARARPGSVLSAARTIGDAVGRKNGRLATEPSIAVPDGSAAAAAARRERALERLLNPLLDGEDGEGDGEGDMQPETTAFAGLPPDQQLPPHPRGSRQHAPAAGAPCSWTSNVRMPLCACAQRRPVSSCQLRQQNVTTTGSKT
jgi:hypothetical protein